MVRRLARLRARWIIGLRSKQNHLAGPAAGVRLNSPPWQGAGRQDQRSLDPRLSLHPHREVRLDVWVLLSGAGDEDLSEQAPLRRRGIGDALDQGVEAGGIGHFPAATQTGCGALHPSNEIIPLP